MKQFAWDAVKNELLRHQRGIGFEDVVFHLEQDDLLDILEHPNPAKYPGQRIFVLNINGYAFLVPFVESKTEIFLKTIIPSRKATKSYLKEKP